MLDRDNVVAALTSMMGQSSGLKVVFTTYNAVATHETGWVSECPHGLRIYVENGGFIPSLDEIVALGAGIETQNVALCEAANRSAESRAGDSQDRIEERAHKVVAVEGEPVLAVVYAGLNAFEKAFATARAIRRQGGDQTRVLVLTCDCMLRHKRPRLDRAKEDGFIDEFLVTGECGGRFSMKQILETLIGIWPSR